MKLRSLFPVERGEWAAVGLSFAYFFTLLACYYTLRPVRDALAASTLGAINLRWAFLGTFLVMLVVLPTFGFLAARLPRRRLLPASYLFFLACMPLWRWLFVDYQDQLWLGLAYYMWLSVFNVFVVSVFWSFMADIFSSDQARRLFGPIAAGGSIGAICGPLLTRGLVGDIGVANLFVVSSVLMSIALMIALVLLRVAPQKDVRSASSMGGGVFEGLTLAIRHPFLRGMTGYMILGTFTGSLLYVLQTRALEGLGRTAAELAEILATVDLAINVLTIILQVLLTGRIVGWLGFAITLTLLPIIALLGFSVLTVVPVLGVIIMLQILRRGALFAIANPVSHMLFASMGPHSKYKFKNFLETAVYRSGDTLGSWTFAAVIGLGGGLGSVAAVGAVAALVWSRLSYWLGSRYEKLKDRTDVWP